MYSNLKLFEVNFRYYSQNKKLLKYASNDLWVQEVNMNIHTFCCTD